MTKEVRKEGIKKILGDEITVGTIVKPKTGLSEADWAKTAKRSYLAGLNVVKDDENLTSQDYCTFEKRVELVYKAIEEVEEESEGFFEKVFDSVVNFFGGDSSSQIMVF